MLQNVAMEVELVMKNFLRRWSLPYPVATVGDGRTGLAVHPGRIVHAFVMRVNNPHLNGDLGRSHTGGFRSCNLTELGSGSTAPAWPPQLGVSGSGCLPGLLP